MIIPVRLKILAAATLLAGGLGAAALQGTFAATPSDTTTTTTPVASASPATSSTGWHGPGPRGPGGPGQFGGRGLLSSAVASYLGVTQADLQQAAQNGQTLEQVAQAHGHTAADLKTFLLGQLKTQLDQAVASGRITAQQETNRLTAAGTMIDKQITTNLQQLQRPPHGPGPGMMGMGGFGGPEAQSVATFLSMTPADLQTALKSGQTLTQIAQAHGKTAADLKTLLLNQASTRIDQLLTTNFQQAAARRQAGHAPATPTATATPG